MWGSMLLTKSLPSEEPRTTYCVASPDRPFSVKLCLLMLSIHICCSLPFDKSLSIFYPHILLLLLLNTGIIFFTYFHALLLYFFHFLDFFHFCSTVEPVLCDLRHERPLVSKHRFHTQGLFIIACLCDPL